MADDLDALLAQPLTEQQFDDLVDEWQYHVGWRPDASLVASLIATVRDLRADYLAALDVIARLTTGWDCLGTDARHPHNHVWYRDEVVADEEEFTGPDPMSDREWRVFCDAAQRATRNTT